MSSEHLSLHRQPFLTPLWLSGVAVVLLAAFVAWLAFATWIWTTAHSTTVIVIRHAEQEASGTDPPLSAAGQERALALARMFGAGEGSPGGERNSLNDGKLDAIYVTAPKRNRDTAAPLAQRLKLEPVVDADDDPAELAYRVLHEHAGGRVLIVGHGDTVAPLVKELSGESSLPPLRDDDYGTMYVITVPRIGTANYVKLTF